MKRYFTLELAQALLPNVGQQLQKIMKLQKALEILEEIEIIHEDDAETVQKDIELNKQFHLLSYKFYKEIQQLEKMGALLKDLEQGLIDFYSLYQGREIFLCWQIGEERITHWHELDSGFVGRKPISLLVKQTGR
ncbi:DUF2203 domain-containing protein [Candidatus Woesearchaeota archaeon]|nr:DUF2203 domain-containing protein [Candidatus Woesearchaeota archaeon]